MIAENDKERRGEPVVLTLLDGREVLATIEWGDAVHHDMSLYLERGGRVILRRGEAHRVKPDPGGERPVWHQAGGALVDTTPGACVLIKREDDRVLAVSRKDGSGFALPGGKVERDETSKIGACRELHEETGAVVTPGRLVLLYRGPYRGKTSSRDVCLYYAHKITNEPFAREGGTTIGWFAWATILTSSPFAVFYKIALPDGIEHLRATELLVLRD